MAGPEHGNEYLGRAQLAGARIDNRNRVSGVIDEAAFAGAVDLAHRWLEASRPAAVVLAILAVLQPIGLGGLVLLPEQHQGHALVAQLLVHHGEIRQRARTGRHHGGRRKQPLFERRIVEILRQGPA